MKVICLVKQVPHPAQISFDLETKTLKREGVPLVLNPFDRHAVRQGARLRDDTGGELVVITMGPPQAEEALRETLALGADRCIHLSDAAFAVADTIGTSRTLALAIAREGADVVLCGRKTVDSETWQVPPEVAAFLGWPHLTSVITAERTDEGLHVTRETDEGDDVYEIGLPAVLSLARAEWEEVEPAGEAGGRISVWAAADLVDDLEPDDKRFGQPGSPTRVLAVRDVTPARPATRAGTCDEAVALARERLEATAPEPSSWDKPEHAAEQPAGNYDCWTVIEQIGGRAARVSLELLARGRHLAGKLGGMNVALVVGPEVDTAARDAAAHGAERVHTVEHAALDVYRPFVWTKVLREVVEHYLPHVLLIPATAKGREYGPRLAGELELGMTGDCVNVDIARAGRLLQTKPAYGGNIVSVIMGSTTPQLATVRPRMFEPLDEHPDAEGTIESVDVSSVELVDVLESRTLLVEEHRDPRCEGWRLDEADVVVVAGPGLGREDVEELERLAGETGAAVGATRQLCEVGLVPWNREVGLSGRAVAPRLLIAVDVPGDFEQLAGFVKAGVIVAVNRDEAAAMLAAADVAYVGDWREVVPASLDNTQTL